MAKKSLKKGDIVRMNYDAYIADNEKLYDTTYEDKAKENGMYNEQYKYAPMPYIVGSGKLFPALDAAITAAEVGKRTVVEIPSEEGAGARDPKLLETHPSGNSTSRRSTRTPASRSASESAGEPCSALGPDV